MTNEEYLKLINQEPEGVKTSEDGSYKFIPISAVESKLDEIYGGEWSFTMDREFFGKGYATGAGTLNVRHPASGYPIYKSGTAAVAMTGQVAMDYPRLEAQIILSASKKIGKVFGRDLNRDKDDAEVPVIPVEKDSDLGDELTNEVIKISAIEFQEDAAAYLQSTNWKYHVFLKGLVAKKPNKPV